MQRSLGIEEWIEEGQRVGAFSPHPDKRLLLPVSLSAGQCLTGTRYPTRPDNFWQYPIRTHFFSEAGGGGAGARAGAGNCKSAGEAN